MGGSKVIILKSELKKGIKCSFWSYLFWQLEISLNYLWDKISLKWWICVIRLHLFGLKVKAIIQQNFGWLLFREVQLLNLKEFGPNTAFRESFSWKFFIFFCFTTKHTTELWPRSVNFTTLRMLRQQVTWHYDPHTTRGCQSL